MPEYNHDELNPYAEVGFEGIESEVENVQRNEEKGVYAGEFSVQGNVISVECRKTENGWDLVMTGSSPVRDLEKVHMSRGAKNLKWALHEARSAVESRLRELDRLYPTVELVQQELSQFGEASEITLTEVSGRTIGLQNTRYEGRIIINGLEYSIRAEVDHAAGTTQYPNESPWTVRLASSGSIKRESGMSLQEVMQKLTANYSK